MDSRPQISRGVTEVASLAMSGVSNDGTFDGFELMGDFWLIAAHRGSEDETEIRAARDGRALLALFALGVAQVGLVLALEPLGRRMLDNLTVWTTRWGPITRGLIFKRDPSSRSRQSCCGAQMFLQDSDGLVFKGAMGPWYSHETKQYHLSRSEALHLVRRLLESYAEEHPEPPRELFIHGRTRFNSEEWAGFCEAIDTTRTRLTGVRITRTNDYKLFSSGERAVQRGTAIRLNHRTGLLWTTGFVERLGTYPGRETPNPLRVEIVNDTDRKTDLDVVMQDIIMLTKMNFNSCIYGDGMPVTMRFADAIGDVLVTVKDKKVPPLPFRYYI